MKKRIVSFTLVLLIVVASLCACGKKKPEVSTDTTPDETTESVETEDVTNENEESEEANADESDGVSSEKIEKDELYLRDEVGCRTIFLTETGEVDFEVKDEDVVLAKFGKECSVLFEGVSGHTIYFDAWSDYENRTLYAYNCDKYEWTKVFDHSNYVNLSFSEDGIYIDESVYNSSLQKDEYFTRLAVLENGNYTVTEIYSNLNGIRSGRNLSAATRFSGGYAQFSLGTCLTKYGLVPLEPDGRQKILLADENGKFAYTIDCDASGDEEIRMMLLGIDEDILLYVTEEDYVLNEVYKFDYGTGEKTLIEGEWTGLDSDHSFEPIEYKNKKLYYAIVDRSAPVKSTVDVKSYNVETGDVSSIYTMKEYPGHALYYSPGMTGFKVIGDDIYVIGDSDERTEWFKYTCSNDSYVGEELGSVVLEYEFPKYGTVKSESEIAICPYCGQKANKFYYEYFQAGEQIPAYEKINAALRENVDLYLADAKDYYPTYTESDCRDFIHAGPVVYSDETTISLDSLRLVKDKYLFVNYQYYYYPAGAVHGNYYNMGFLFDKDTGDLLTLNDICAYSEEDLKKAVATAAERMYNEDAVFANTVWQASSQEIYDYVYERACYDFDMISYYEDYLTFDFPPYELASYADGIVSIKVMYEDLDIFNSL